MEIIATEKLLFWVQIVVVALTIYSAAKATRLVFAPTNSDKPSTRSDYLIPKIIIFLTLALMMFGLIQYLALIAIQVFFWAAKAIKSWIASTMSL